MALEYISSYFDLRKSGSSSVNKPTSTATTLKVITMNLSLEHPDRIAVATWAKLLSEFDVIALQECLNHDGSSLGVEIAASLGRIYLGHKDAANETENDEDQCLIVKKEVAHLLERVGIRSVHFASLPYSSQRIRDGLIQPHEAKEEGRLARELELYTTLEEVEPLGNVIILGDFNEVSHHDNHFEGATAGAYYVSHELHQFGYRDAFREHNPHDYGATWPRALYEEQLERIDFIYYKGNNLRLIESGLFDSGLSDHFGVVATFAFE